MRFTIIINTLTDTINETFGSDCNVELDKKSRYLHIERNDGTDLVSYVLADSDRLEIRYHA